MLTKNEIAAKVEQRTGVKPTLTKNVLDAVAVIAAEHIGEGNDLTIPGLVKFAYGYRAPAPRGSRWKKGNTRVNNITKEETIAETDSPPVTERGTLKAQPVGLVGKVRPKTTPEAQRAFFKTKAGKLLRSRKG